MVALDFRFGGEHAIPSFTHHFGGAHACPDGRRGRWFRSLRVCAGHLAHLLGMNTTRLGSEPLIGVEELAAYLGVPVQTIYDWRMSGRAPRAYKFGKHLRFALSDVQAWLEERHEGRGSGAGHE
jgi:excisionase family DNA binding protein